MGFAAEIKEFLGAAKESWKLMSDTEKTNATNRYTIAKAIETEKENNDPLNQKLKEAKLAGLQGENAERGKGNALDQQLIDLIKKSQGKGDPVLGRIPDSDSSTGAGAIPAPPRAGTTATETYDPSYGALPPRPTQVFRKGGLVRKFAEGGIVEGEDLEPGAGAIDVGGAGGYDMSARRRDPAPALAIGSPTPPVRDVDDPAIGPPLPPALRATADALKYGYSQVPQAPQAIGGGGRGSSRTRMLLALAQGAGAAPGSDMLAILKKIDPTGKKYTEGERNLRALNEVHEFKKGQGDAEGAAKTAFQMLQHFRTAQTRYGALAAAAMKNGHVEEGVKLALKQYANIPDGNNLQMWTDKKSGRIGWEIETPDGKKSGGVATPEEIGAASARLAAPGGFEQHLTQMISGAKIGGSTVPAGGGRKTAAAADDEEEGGAPKASEYKGVETSVKSHLQKWQDDYEKSDAYKKSGKKLTPQEITTTGDMLHHIRSNNNVTNNQGMQLIEKYIKAPHEIPEGGQPAFNVTRDPKTKMVTLEFDNGGVLKLPQDTYSSVFAAARGAHLQELEKEKNKPKEKGYGEMAGEAGEALLKGAKGKLETVFGPTVEAAKKGGFTPETYKEAIPTAGRAINELTPVGWVKPGLEGLGKMLPQNPGEHATPIDDPYSLK